LTGYPFQTLGSTFCGDFILHKRYVTYLVTKTDLTKYFIENEGDYYERKRILKRGNSIEADEEEGWDGAETSSSEQ